MARRRAVVLGGGFAGLASALSLSRRGWHVTLVEQHEELGGRARMWRESGFSFDMGPSWYWMPDVFERFFGELGERVDDHYQLVRLDPAYRVVFEHDSVEVDASRSGLTGWMESREPGSGAALERFLSEAAEKYRVGMGDLVYRPGRSLFEFADPRVLQGLLRLQLLTSMRRHVQRHFRDPLIRQLLEFPVLFLGAVAANTPALYSLMNHADLELGTWYPMGGMVEVVRAMERMARARGIEIRTATRALGIRTEGRRVVGLEVAPADAGQGDAGSATDTGGEAPTTELVEGDVLVASADYHHVDRVLLGPERANYGERYWAGRTMAPSSLLLYLGLDRRLDGLRHHTLFFDASMDAHADAIYTRPRWPEEPLFYTSIPSRTDPSVAPEGGEALTVLVPLAPGLHDDEAQRDRVRSQVFERFRQHTGVDLERHIVVERGYAMRDFERDYHAFRGNAYGLANTLRQTALLKPSLRHRRFENLYYSGQLTVPGPGVPPSLISGMVVAEQIERDLG